jgi:hypothetical protein
MKIKSIQLMSIMLAGLLQVAPLLRSFLPNATGLAPSAWGIILKLGVGTAGWLGFDAVSQASSISIAPANATVGVAYVGTVSYSGGHAGAVSSMMMSNACLGTAYSIGNGLSIVYAGGNLATVGGTPLAVSTNESFTVKVWEGSACGGGHSDTHSTALIIGPSGGGAVAPSITATPQNACAQIGTTVQLSGGASGNPIPQYQWWLGVTPIPGATNSILTLPNVQLTNAGLYTMTASNSSSPGGFGALPKANCYLSVAVTPGTNITALNYTNFAPAGVALTMFSVVTNYSNISNNYNWYYNGSGVAISSSNTLPLSASFLVPSKSGTYSVLFTNSLTNSGGIYVGQVIPPGSNTFNFYENGQEYDSYWAFGYLPMLTNSLPAATNVNPGDNVTFSVAVGGTLNVYNAYGGTIAGSYFTNNVTPCVFWYQNGSLVAAQNYVLGPISGATYSNSAVNATLTLNNISAANAGSYTVVATNFWGSVTSTPAILSVAGSGYSPVITTNPPAALSLLAGQSFAISVTVTGTPPLSFQWRKADANLVNGGVYGGVLTNTLTLTGVTNGNAGSYSVAITNSIGAATSSVAVVAIALPPSVTVGPASPGQLQLSANTLTGLTYVVQMATNLVAPVWIPVLTNGTGSSGTINFLTNTTAGLNTFYQIKFP